MTMNKETSAKLHDDGQKELRAKLGRRLLILQIVELVLVIAALIVGIINLVRGLYWQAALDLLILVGVAAIFIPLRRLHGELTKTRKA
ncbi:hypothetical protein [Lacticaseibacillus songhuajiangensis]|jgi:hypothetical protein|uniref:hypothetical protein n=1 Tax=Lacticaseibacillus songhuajiangensis TaxID=1296539 RepID=UPI000F7A4DAA|nr:hypothetical protein [Lacticaseibacillus songhuajiangensis]MCI1284146.1 hypothetical protein [Lacticaseibacillus songhuajiangensis]